MSVPVELARLNQAIEQFTQRPPRELPDGLLDKVKELGQTLNEVAPAGGDTPGRREAREVAGQGDVGEREKVKGSPGTRAANTAQEFATAASKLAERVSPGATDGDGN